MSRRPAESRRCVAAVAAVRAEPRDDSEQVTQVVFGEQVLVDRTRDGWCRVVTSYDYPGWIRADALSSRDPLTEARAYIGAPYEWGGMTDAGIDCSGLVHMAFRRAGLRVPRDADQQEAAAREVREGDMRPGDLITYGGDSADHIAFWAGGGSILHATGRAGVVSVVEEPEPPELAARRRKLIRFDHSPDVGSAPP
jgi:gamma-D-glutamyl-L-lysine dipeptidyl-peptidase